MAFMEIEEKFQVREESLTLAGLLSKAPISLAETIKNKSVVILPSHGTIDAFYAGSLDILDHLNNNEIDADIYASDEDYKELSLHGADIWLGTFFITSVVVPIFCNVISSYIYDKLKAKNEDKISLQIIVERKNGTTTSVNFDGKIESLDKAINAVKELDDAH
ncbi:hypothetical protein D3880_00615 [Pseudomonas cavernae]|uniref:Uncharacterized protein n=1 Tax=Pseudomonas cavernae TaxID=2320867 RepID=A0A385YYF8_9PSED|nr:hypothetical protein [Pseudomonas cavernae]AYC30977.1 hypothetical protein D3880_00615 [Pseudomonas cavernae]